VRIGPLLFFEPINPSQATQTQRIASHAKKLFGEEKVIVLPIRNDWDMSAFVAFIAELAKHGILVCNDSAPAHIGRAGGASVLEIGNRRFNPNFYTPEGSMVVLPAEGDDASGVRPHDVVEAFLNMAKTLLEN